MLVLVWAQSLHRSAELSHLQDYCCRDNLHCEQEVATGSQILLPERGAKVL